MPKLLTFLGSVERDPAVESWLAAQPRELTLLARRWLESLRRCGSNVRELMHDGYATVCVCDAPFAYVGVFKAHVNVGFFYGSELPDPDGLLLGTGKRMRHVKVGPRDGVNESALETLVNVAYADIVARLGAPCEGARKQSEA